LLLIRNTSILAIVLLVSACATQPTAPSQQPTTSVINQQHLATLANIKAFALKGRLGVVTQKQGFSGGIDWQHQAITDNIDVFSPVGGKIANIAKNPSGVTLTDQKGRSISAQDAESLTETTLGFRLPLNGLNDWALGRPTTSKIDSANWDETGRLTALKQDGWDISYENYAQNNGVFLPNLIVLKSEKVNLKLLVEKWVGVGN
jgi:outer membrane lipoprotein LolB